MMSGASNDSCSSSMSPFSSPSPIVYIDLYGKRRQVAKVQVLEREIGLLQEEIKSLAELELASRCCKELDDYVEATPDPLIAINQIRGGSRSCWKNLRRKIGSMLRCCCCCGCCKPKVCCSSSCLPRKDCCCKCPEISCQCRCNPACLKCWGWGCCSCCSKPCSCF